MDLRCTLRTNEILNWELYFIRENHKPFNEEMISLKNDPMGHQSRKAGRTNSLLFLYIIFIKGGWSL
jgi:hypothetical protein